MKHPIETSVYLALAAKDMAAAAAFNQIFKSLPSESINDQIRHLNRFWRQQLNLANVECPTVRAALQDDIAVDLWLDNFSTYVIPFLIEQGLPSTHPPQALNAAIERYQQSYQTLQMSV